MTGEMYLYQIIYILQLIPATTSNLACEHLNTFVFISKTFDSLHRDKRSFFFVSFILSYFIKRSIDPIYGSTLN